MHKSECEELCEAVAEPNKRRDVLFPGKQHEVHEDLDVLRCREEKTEK